MEWIEVKEEGRSAILEADSNDVHYEIVEAKQYEDEPFKGYAIIRFPPEEQLEVTDEYLGYISNKGEWLGKTVIGIAMANAMPLPDVCVFPNLEEAKEVAEEDLTVVLLRRIFG